MSVFLLLCNFAMADGFSDAIESAKKALKEEKYSDMNKFLKTAKKEAVKTKRIIPTDEFLQLYFIRAAAEFKQGNTDEAIPYLRESLIASPPSQRLEQPAEAPESPTQRSIPKQIQDTPCRRRC